jgi:hypothetical protein
VRSVALREGERTTLRLTFDAPIHSAPNASSKVVTQSTRARPFDEGMPAGRVRLGWALLGIGTAAFVATGVMVPMILDRKRVVDERCPDNLCDESGYQAGTEGRALVTAATVTTLTGAAATAAGLYFVFSKTKAGEARTKAVLGTSTTGTGTRILLRGEF